MTIIDENGQKTDRIEDGSLVQIYMDWPPTVNNYYTVTQGPGKGRKILSKRGKAWKAEQLIQLRIQGVPQYTDGTFAVSITACPPDRRRRDLDNILKPALDVLVDYRVIPDDGDIDELHIRRAEKIDGGVIKVLIRRIVE